MNGSKPSTSEICPLCQGYKIVEEDDPAHPGQVKTVPCRCQTPKRWQPAPAYARMTFSEFKARPSEPSVQVAAQAALDFVRDDRTILTFSGPNGTGKTHLAVAIAHEMALAGKTPIFWSVAFLLDAIKRTFNDDSAPDVFTPCLDADVLVLDDLGAEKASDWVAEKLFMILDYRYMHEAKTVVTTNLEPMSGLPPRISSRLCDVRQCRVLVMKARDIRLIK